MQVMLRVRAIAVALVGALVLSLLTALPSSAGTGPQSQSGQVTSISGTVTAPEGTVPIVSLVQADDESAVVESATPATDGSYSFSGVAVGSYKVKFAAEDDAAAPQWWEGAIDFDSATVIELAADSLVIGIDAALADEAAAPVAAEQAEVVVDGAQSGDQELSEEPAAEPAEVDPNAGNQIVVPEDSSDTEVALEVAPEPSLEDAAAAARAEDQLTASQYGRTASVTATGTGSISGTVTVPAGTRMGSFSSDVWVNLYDVNDNGKIINSVYPNSSGLYSFTGLAAGTYKVRFITSSDVNVVNLWWGSKTTFAASNAIVLKSGEKKTAINQNLVKGATVSGVVTIPSLSTLSGMYIWIDLYDANQNWIAGGDAAANGTYTVTKIPAGTYTLRFTTNKSSTLANEYWNNQYSFSDATPLTFAAGQVRAGLNVVIEKKLQSGYPSITTPRAIGESYKADPGTWTSGTTLKYQWYTFGDSGSIKTMKPIPGATKSSLVLTSALASKWVGVSVTGSKAGYTSVKEFSSLMYKARLSSLKTATPTISGTVAYGSTLKVKTGSWTSGAKFSYQWYANGKAIKGATKSSFKLGKSQKGTKITVKVTGSKYSYTTASKTSKATGKVATAATPTISGSVKAGKTLKAKTGTWTKGTKFSYQWYANGKAIKGATKSSYKVSKSVKGKKITVKVTGSKSGYAKVGKTSKATGKVK